MLVHIGTRPYFYSAMDWPASVTWNELEIFVSSQKYPGVPRAGRHLFSRPQSSKKRFAKISLLTDVVERPHAGGRRNSRQPQSPHADQPLPVTRNFTTQHTDPGKRTYLRGRDVSCSRKGRWFHHISNYEGAPAIQCSCSLSFSP